MSARKTKELKYNLHDRGLKHNGTDRSNVDFDAMINLINSNQVQEVVSVGAMHGYYGHQIRQRFGMNPPEVAFVNGKKIMIEPAFRTTSISAKPNGDVHHVAEFFENDAGEYAMRQYKARVGGFSTAVNYAFIGNRQVPTGYFGFDYVTQPNYATNIGDGQLYDGMFIPQNNNGEHAFFDNMTNIDELDEKDKIIIHMLENDIIQTFDNMAIQNQLFLQQEQALAVIEQEAKAQKRNLLIQKRQLEQGRSICQSVQSFDSVIQQAQKDLERTQLIGDFEKKDKKKKGLVSNVLNNLFG